MRFWLRWAIVTLPVVVCVVLWIQSYWTGHEVRREGYHNELYLSVHRGSFGLAIMRDDQWTIAGGRWSRQNRSAGTVEDHLTQNRFLGFGYESIPGPTVSLSATVIEIPAWFITLLLAIPPLWLYLRQRKRSKVGFPVEPAAANPSK